MKFIAMEALYALLLGCVVIALLTGGSIADLGVSNSNDRVLEALMSLKLTLRLID